MTKNLDINDISQLLIFIWAVSLDITEELLDTLHWKMKKVCEDQKCIQETWASFYIGPKKWQHSERIKKQQSLVRELGLWLFWILQ